MASPQKILVTGSNGQVGKEISDLAFAFPQFEFVFLNREQLSIADEQSVATVMALHQPQYLVNCAAYTAVDKAEEEKEISFQVNGTAVGYLAKYCRQHQTKFIHISTDYVFDGNSQLPVKEDAAVSPVNTYGAGKLLGEQEALANNPDAIIIRTAWVYSAHGKNFVKTMMRLMKEKETISVVNDQVGSPTWAADLAQAIMSIIISRQWVPGIYHYSNEGVISWFDFAVAINKILGTSCEVKPISSAQFPTPAKRPAYSVLDKTKIKNTFGLTIPAWQYSLQQCMQRLLAATKD